jgi:hypothetical protein
MQRPARVGTLLAVIHFFGHGGAVDASASEDLPPFKLGLSTQIVAAGFDLIPKTPGPKGSKLTYRPAQANYAGVILGYRWIGGTVSFGIPASADIRAVEGTSRYRDYRLSYFTSSFGAEVSYTRYMGYLIDNSSSLSDATLNGKKYYQIPDLETLGYGINLFYVISPKEYSLPAAMEQSAIQEKSGGAPLIVASWRQQAITSNSPLVPAEKAADFGADQLMNVASTTTLAAGMGYGHCFVYSPFFVSGMGAVTVGYQNVSYKAQGTESSFTSPAGNINLRLSLGANVRRYLLVASLYIDHFTQETSSVEIGNNVYGLTVSGAVRF